MNGTSLPPGKLLPEKRVNIFHYKMIVDDLRVLKWKIERVQSGLKINDGQVQVLITFVKTRMVKMSVVFKLLACNACMFPVGAKRQATGPCDLRIQINLWFFIISVVSLDTMYSEILISWPLMGLKAKFSLFWNCRFVAAFSYYGIILFTTGLIKSGSTCSAGKSCTPYFHKLF